MHEPLSDNTESILVGIEGAPEIFVEGFHGALYRAGVVKLNMFSTRVLGPGHGNTREAACILSMPLADLKEMAPALMKLVAYIEELELSVTTDIEP